MYDDDKPNFRAAMNALGIAFRRAISDQLVAVYWAGLEEYPFHAVGRAMTVCVKTCKTFPKVAEIRGALNLTVVNSGVRGGTFPPDIAAQRRRYHLPVTDEEFRAYDRQTHEGSGAPPLTKFERAQILRASIVNTKSVVHRAAMIKRAERYERGEDVPDEDLLSAFTSAVRVKKSRDREPGEEG